jgi:hypothetical protein
MLLSCLGRVSDEPKEGKRQRTWVMGRPCTGSRSCSLCRIDTAELHHIFAFANGSGYRLAWRAPAFVVSAVLCHSCSCTGSACRVRQDGSSPRKVVAAGIGMAVCWRLNDLWCGCIHSACCRWGDALGSLPTAGVDHHAPWDSGFEVYGRYWY